jgi:imidazolonepropionase-like amidohydrolase
MWLLPGLMNMHVHFGLVLPGAAGAELADETEAELALRMAAAARASLRGGVTTVRLTGERTSHSSGPSIAGMRRARAYSLPARAYRSPAATARRSERSPTTAPTSFARPCGERFARERAGSKS